jgi:nitroreductase/NAD-dependent dihydropyrimidine dehydrogenase PreA subunit
LTFSQEVYNAPINTPEAKPAASYHRYRDSKNKNRKNNGKMAQLIIDLKKCVKDGICADECPLKIISLNGPTRLPELKPGAESACCACGHCVAVCPQGALDCSESPLHQCSPIQKDKIIDKDQAVQFLRSRRSARVFKNRAVEKAQLQELIEIARYAPTASNSQLLEWIVLTDRHQIAGLVERTIAWMRELIEQGPLAIYSPYIIPAVNAWDAGQDRILKNAPALVFATAPIEAVYGMVDLTIALSYLDLIAPTAGLITCWAGVLHRAMEKNPSLKHYAGIPDTHPYYYPMMIGYPKHPYYRLPARKPPNIIWR